MGREWIRQVTVKPDGVYLYSKGSNDNCSYNLWKCDSLTEVYENEGQRGLDREIVRMLCEYAQIKGTHYSVERYRPCLLARGHFSIDHVKALDAEYVKLTPDDLATNWLPDEQKTPAIKAYRQFSDAEYNKYYTTLAGCAAPIKKPPRDNGAR
jgi:hypothetical protein